MDLAKIGKTGEALNSKTSFFFGADAAALGSVISNPKLVK